MPQPLTLNPLPPPSLFLPPLLPHPQTQAKDATGDKLNEAKEWAGGKTEEAKGAAEDARQSASQKAEDVKSGAAAKWDDTKSGAQETAQSEWGEGGESRAVRLFSKALLIRAKVLMTDPFNSFLPPSHQFHFLRCTQRLRTRRGRPPTSRGTS
jgi:hypothetical protein